MNTTPSWATEDGQLVVCRVGGAEYGLPIAAVNTILRTTPIPRVPHTDTAVEGVINLRGVVVPVISLRRLFGMLDVDETPSTRIIIVEHRHMLFGLLVEAVNETMHVAQADIEPLAALAQIHAGGSIWGVAHLDTRIILLLDLEQLVPLDEAA